MWLRAADLDLVCHPGSPSDTLELSGGVSQQETCLSVVTLARDSFNFFPFGGEEREMGRSPMSRHPGGGGVSPGCESSRLLD